MSSTNIEAIQKHITNIEAELNAAKTKLEQVKKEKATGVVPRWYDGMPVTVSDTEEGLTGTTASKRYLKEVKGGYYYCYEVGATPFSGKGSCIAWRYCKPDYSAPSMITWIPNPGYPPTVNITTLVKYRRGNISLSHPGLDWSMSGSLGDIIEYGIIA